MSMVLTTRRGYELLSPNWRWTRLESFRCFFLWMSKILQGTTFSAMKHSMPKSSTEAFRKSSKIWPYSSMRNSSRNGIRKSAITRQRIRCIRHCKSSVTASPNLIIFGNWKWMLGLQDMLDTCWKTLLHGRKNNHGRISGNEMQGSLSLACGTTTTQHFLPLSTKTSPTQKPPFGDPHLTPNLTSLLVVPSHHPTPTPPGVSTNPPTSSLSHP